MLKNYRRDICPVCGGQLVQVEIERDDDSAYAAETIRQECKHCGGVFIQCRKRPRRKKAGRKNRRTA